MVVLLEEKFNYYRMYNVIAYATLNKSYKTLVAIRDYANFMKLLNMEQFSF